MTPDTGDFMRAHTMAVMNLLHGNRKMKLGFAICGGEPLDVDGHIRIAQMAKMSDTDVVHLEFGTLANHSYGMTGISVIFVRESKYFVQTGCQLWLGEIVNRAVILPRPESRGHFRLSPREIIHIDGSPPRMRPKGAAERKLGWSSGCAQMQRCRTTRSSSTCRSRHNPWSGPQRILQR